MDERLVDVAEHEFMSLSLSTVLPATEMLLATDGAVKKTRLQ